MEHDSWRGLYLRTDCQYPAAFLLGPRLDGFSNISFGVTSWYRGSDGIDYRLSGRTSIFYLPSTYRSVAIPVRATHPHTQVDVVFKLDGEMVNTVRIGADGCQVVRLPVPPASFTTRFRRLDVEVTSTVLTPRVLYVGRITSP